ncbi:MAG: DUF2007 domain-containing protein [Candidatus Aminicenantes bacterium]|jgi:hypothetical protein|nr:DUF2007 domain-containing protein [Candidatus Aminicenantes bacterium]
MAELDEKKRPPDEDADLVEAARVFGPFEADLIRNILESHGVASIVRGRTAPFVYPFTVDGLAEFKVMVQEKDLEKAKDLLAAMPATDEENGSGKAG